MSWRLIRATERKVMAWKNGQGSTAEIAIGPEGAGLGDFDWRLSIAEVGADGPFSAFPGIDRTLTLIAGAGMELRFADGRKLELNAPFRPADFSGDQPCDCRLLGGPIRDFNLMVRRSRYKARWAVAPAASLTLGDMASASVGLSDRDAEPLLLLHLFAGTADADGQALAAGDSLVVEGRADWPSRLAGEGIMFGAILTPV